MNLWLIFHRVAVPRNRRSRRSIDHLLPMVRQVHTKRRSHRLRRLCRKRRTILNRRPQRHMKTTLMTTTRAMTTMSTVMKMMTTSEHLGTGLPYAIELVRCWRLATAAERKQSYGHCCRCQSVYKVVQYCCVTRRRDASVACIGRVHRFSLFRSLSEQIASSLQPQTGLLKFLRIPDYHLEILNYVHTGT